MFILCAMNALERAISIFKTQTALAKEIDELPQTVSNWLRRGSVPAEHCPAIERATSGEVTCEQLRPDVDWAYLRGTEKKAA